MVWEIRRCLLVIVLACGWMSAACSAPSRVDRSVSPAPSSHRSPSTASASRDAEASNLRIRIPEPGGAVAAFGSVWVQSEPKGSLWRIAPDGRVLARIRGVSRNPGRYGPFQTLSNGFGSIWTLTKHAVVRIDPATNARAAVIPVEAPVAIVAGLGAMWVAGGRGAVKLSRIDPSDNSVTAIRRGTSSAGLGVGLDRVWWINYSEASSVSAIDPATGTDRYIQTPMYVSFIVSSPVGMWLIDRDGQIASMSPDSLQPGERRTVAKQVMGVDLSAETIWLNTGDLVGVDAATGKVTSTTPIGGERSPDALAGVARLGPRVWVVDIDHQELVGVDVRTTTG
jgi:hypothetical protein